eukprot:9476708-Pyramimonas_sp.AAC.1
MRRALRRDAHSRTRACTYGSLPTSVLKNWVWVAVWRLRARCLRSVAARLLGLGGGLAVCCSLSPPRRRLVAHR